MLSYNRSREVTKTEWTVESSLHRSNKEIDWRELYTYSGIWSLSKEYFRAETLGLQKPDL